MALYASIDRAASQFAAVKDATGLQSMLAWYTGLSEWSSFRKPSGVTPELTRAIPVQNRVTGVIETEFVPGIVLLAIKAMYTSDVSKLIISHPRLLLAMSKHSGRKYRSKKSIVHIAEFVDTYNIDVSQNLKPLSEFKSFNDFFIREMKPEARPIFNADDDNFMVSAADCRLTLWDNISDATRVWVKGSNFTLPNLLHNTEGSATFEGGAFVIFRLAPQDYHRFHYPVSGVVTDVIEVNGALFTVNPLAIHSHLDVYGLNKRVIIYIDSPQFGKVCMVCVGATVVGSIVVFGKKGQSFKKGQQAGFFQYGGSTVLTLFQKGRVQFDEDIVRRSLQPIETYIKVGDSVGKAITA